jgi:cell division transport system permease protein
VKAKERKSGARRSTARIGGRKGSAWLPQHRASVADTIGDLRSNVGAVVLSVLVIGVTLALPLGLHVLLENFHGLVARLGSRPQATLFLDPSGSRADAEALARTLRRDHRLGPIRVIDNDQALSDFERSSGLGGVIEALAENPLPQVLSVEIDFSRFDDVEVRGLQRKLEQAPGVAQAEFDITWIRRLQAISDVAVRATLVVTAILAFGVVLITGNTIRVGIDSRRDEIEVIKLCGATDAFVRRPFLYSGALQGLLGAIVACAVVWLAVGALDAPAQRLAAAYGSDLRVLNLSARSLVSVLASGAGLGWAGAWIAVAVYLRRIDVTTSD